MYKINMYNQMYKNERWINVEINIENFEVKYQISDYGRIRRWSKKYKEWRIQKLMTAKKNSNFIYFRFQDSKKGVKFKSESIHRLVARYFLEQPRPDQKYVIHLDYNHENNHYRNLKWVNTQEMEEHRKKNPIFKGQKRISNSKLDETKVIRLKKKLKRGKVPFYKLAKEFNISHTQLKRIRRGENWGHVIVD